MSEWIKKQYLLKVVKMTAYSGVEETFRDILFRNF